MKARVVIATVVVAWSLACGGAPAADPAPVVEGAPAEAPSVATTAWDGTTTFECGGMEKHTIKGVKANVASGPAVSAVAMCEVVLEDVELTASTGIEASGKARVVMSGGRIDAKTAVDASGEAVVSLQGTAVQGGISKGGLAKVEQTGAAAASAPAAAPAAGSSGKVSKGGVPKDDKPTKPTKPSAPSAADVKWACDQAFTACKDEASYANMNCRSGCSPDGSCDAGCQACKDACDDVYDEAHTACDRTWQSCG